MQLLKQKTVEYLEITDELQGQPVLSLSGMSGVIKTFATQESHAVLDRKQKVEGWGEFAGVNRSWWRLPGSTQTFCFKTEVVK